MRQWKEENSTNISFEKLFGRNYQTGLRRLVLLRKRLISQAFPLERGAGSGILFKRYDLAGAKIWGSLVIMRLDDSDPIPPPSKEKIKRVNPSPTYAWAKPRVVDHQRTSHSQKKPKQIRGHVYRLKTINSAVSEWCKKEKQIFIQNQYILFRSSGFTTFTFTNYYPVCY